MNNCPACDGQVWQEFLLAADMYNGVQHRILRCETCGLAKTEDEAKASSHESYVYRGSPDAGRRFGPMQWVLRLFRRRRLRDLPAKRVGRALDVGCGDGSFLDALAQQGWDVNGTELSASIAATALERLGDRIRVGGIGEAGFPSGSFDLVTFWHVLEHLEDPGYALTEAGRLLKVGGRIVVAVPNINSWQAGWFKGGWLHLDVPRHRWHFSPKTLETLANRCGLCVEHVRHFSLEYGPFAILQGIATKFGLGHALFTRVVRLSPAGLACDPLFWLHLPLLALAIVPSLLLELFAALNGRGGMVEMILRQADPSSMQNEREPASAGSHDCDSVGLHLRLDGEFAI